MRFPYPGAYETGVPLDFIDPGKLGACGVRGASPPRGRARGCKASKERKINRARTPVQVHGGQVSCRRNSASLSGLRLGWKLFVLIRTIIRHFLVFCARFIL